jgi:dihydrofolate reductase
LAKLIYAAIASLDGYVADQRGNFDWAAPDEEVHAFVNDLERSIGGYLYGRRMYETMLAWETMPLAISRPWCGISRRSGGRPRRSSTRRPWARSPVLGGDSNETSVLTRSGG